MIWSSSSSAIVTATTASSLQMRGCANVSLGRDDGEASGDTATPAGHQLSPQASTAEANACQPVELVPRAADRGGGEHRRGLLERRGRGEP